MNWTQHKRNCTYLREITWARSYAKEVRVYGLKHVILNRFIQAYTTWYDAHRRLTGRQTVGQLAAAAVGHLSLYGAQAIAVYHTLSGYGDGGVRTIGALTLLMGSFRQGTQVLRQVLGVAPRLYEHGLRSLDYFDLINQLGSALPEGRRPVARPIIGGIEFDDVTFVYPGTEKEGLSLVSCEMRMGEIVVLAGPNGAGKSTLLKLMMRLYDPTSGVVRLDGVDLREYDPDDLRTQFGVLFQDYCRYQLTLRDNIAFGNVFDVSDTNSTATVPKHFGIDEIAASLNGGYQQRLGRAFDGGIELSGGQWQRVALARAFMKESQILALDEPTASVDDRGRWSICQAIVEDRQRRVTVIASHDPRLIRLADRVLVMKAGRLVECRSVVRNRKHDDLVPHTANERGIQHVGKSSR